MDKKVMAVLIVTLSGLLTWSLVSSASGPQAQDASRVGQQPTVAPVLHYQGRLTNAVSGEPVADGSYTMVLRLYDEASGGTPLWTETKDVPVQEGIFSTTLGDTTPLDQSLFDGQTLWLGIKVGTDGEATPRQRLLPVAYALGLAPGAVISTTRSSPALEVQNLGSGEALKADGNLHVSGRFRAHYEGTAIAGYTYGEDPIAATIYGENLGEAGIGIEGVSAAGIGALGESSEGAGVVGVTGYGDGMLDEALRNEVVSQQAGVYGWSSSGSGGYFHSDGGTAIHAAGDAEVTGDLTVHGSLNGGVHSHNGEAITGGTVAEPYIDSEIARDGEIMPTVLGNDGAGSTLDADRLDGYDAAGLMSAAGTTTLYGSTTTDSVTEMDRFTVQVPGPGTVTLMIMGSAFLDCDATSSSSRFCYGAALGICDTPGSQTTCGQSYRQLYYEDPDNASPFNTELWLTMARTVDVPAGGSRTFYLNGNSYEDGMTWRIQGYVVGMFSPTSMTLTNP